MFLTDAEFRRHVSGALKVREEEMAGYWDDLAQKAHQSAYFDVRGALLARGFTATQVDAWDRGAEYERDIGLYWVGVRGDWPGGDLERLKLLDRRKELEIVPVEVAGGATQVPTGSPLRPTFGLFATTDPVTGDDDLWSKTTVF